MKIFKKILLVFTLSFFQITFAQVTFIIEDFPENTSKEKGVYISGNFEEWSGGKKEYKLRKIDNFYYITIPKQKKPLNFKFTQGTWDLVETDLNNVNIENRTYTFNYIIGTVFVKIQNWSNADTKNATVSKNVSVFANNFEIPQLNRERRIWVYLPPNYKVSNKNYPVLYMHDGQNLFSEATAFADEWKIDETLDRLYKEKGFELIVVGIDNGNETRMNEYSPWDNDKYGKGEGNAYLEFIVKTLKPEIDNNYRTLSDYRNTGIMGSSMGGLISHYAGLKYPSIFGKVGVFSPSFWYADDSFQFAEKNSKNNNSKMYFSVGQDEGLNMISDAITMTNIMKINGFNKSSIKNKMVAREKHNEKFWSNEFKDAVLWLFSNKR